MRKTFFLTLCTRGSKKLKGRPGEASESRSIKLLLSNNPWNWRRANLFSGPAHRPLPLRCSALSLLHLWYLRGVQQDTGVCSKGTVLPAFYHYVMGAEYKSLNSLHVACTQSSLLISCNMILVPQTTKNILYFCLMPHD